MPAALPKQFKVTSYATLIQVNNDKTMCQKLIA